MSSTKRPALYKPAYARKPAAVVQEEKKRKREEREEEQRRRRELKQQREVERQARIEEGKKLEVLCRQVEGPHVWTGARTEDFVGRWTLTARLPRKAGFDEDDPQERPPGKGRFMLTRSTGIPGDPPNKLRGLLDIPIPEVCEWDEWAYEEMLVEATVVEGRGYLEFAVFSRSSNSASYETKWYSGAGTMTILKDSTVDGGGPMRALGTVRLRDFPNVDYLTFEALVVDGGSEGGAAHDDDDDDGDYGDGYQAREEKKLFQYRKVEDLVRAKEDGEED